MGGGDFQFGGFIQSTTDAFGSNKSILSLIEKGTYPTGRGGNYDRGSFGDFVFIMDVPMEEYKIHHHGFVSYKGESVINNGYILGYVDRKSMEFYPNSGYNPASVPPLEYEINDHNPHKGDGQPVSIPSPASDQDQGQDNDVF